MSIQHMSIHRALAEIKLYDKKIYDLLQRDYVISYKTKATKLEGMSVEDYGKMLQGNLQSLNALIKNRQVLKSAIAKSNETTIIKIAGEEMTVLDAIERKNFANLRAQVIQTLRVQFNRATQQVKVYEDSFQRGLEDYIAKATKDTTSQDMINALTESYRKINEVALLDPNNLRAVIEDMSTKSDAFNTEVDYVLSESNSTTFIDVDLAD